MRDRLERVAREMISLPPKELVQKLDDPKIIVFDAMIGRIIQKAKTSGKYKALRSLLTKYLGRDLADEILEPGTHDEEQLKNSGIGTSKGEPMRAARNLRVVEKPQETRPREDDCMDPVEGPRNMAAHAGRLVRVIVSALGHGGVTDQEAAELDDIFGRLVLEYSRGAVFGRAVQRTMDRPSSS
jgi:hypothetical protein